VTLSERLAKYAQQRVAAVALAGRVEVRLQDYRDILGEAEFDKIVSIGMCEPVGIANLPEWPTHSTAAGCRSRSCWR
jgi:cyclopropane-fatty-acyl-phospholipid synthase